jgi:4-hydroxybenzoate polyprenyltransferase
MEAVKLSRQRFWSLRRRFRVDRKVKDLLLIVETLGGRALGDWWGWKILLAFGYGRLG